MSQIIIIESAEAFARELARALLNDITRSVEKTLLSCLHPIEVPSDAGEVVNAIILLFAEAQVGQTEEAIAKAIAKAAALIESYSRRVPRAMLREVYNLSSIEWERSADAIAAKYGVKVEE